MYCTTAKLSSEKRKNSSFMKKKSLVGSTPDLKCGTECFLTSLTSPVAVKEFQLSLNNENKIICPIFISFSTNFMISFLILFDLMKIISWGKSLRSKILMSTRVLALGVKVETHTVV